MANECVINPSTGNLDQIGKSASDVAVDDLRYIMLDLSNIPVSPVTDGYAVNGNTLELWWNGTLVESWTVTPVAPDLDGIPMGFGGMLHLTYPV